MAFVSVQCDVCGHAWTAEWEGDSSAECLQCYSRVFLSRSAPGPVGDPETTASTEAFRCAGHPECLPAFRCDRCQRLACGDCVEPRRVQAVEYFVCPCGGAANPLSPEESGIDPPILSDALREALQYPLSGQGKYLLLVMAGCFLLLRCVSQLLPMLGILSTVATGALTGFLLGSAYQVILRTALGTRDELDWQDFTSIWEAVGQPVVNAVVVLLCCGWPALLYVLLRGPGGVFFLPLVLACALLVPLLMSHVAVNGLGAIRDLPTISRQLRDSFALYASVSAALLVAAGIVLLSASSLRAAPVLGPPLADFLCLHAVFFGARLLGFYTRHTHPQILGLAAR